MIARASRPVRRDPLETQIEQFEFVDEDIDRSNRIVLVDPVFQTIRKQRRLAPIDTLDKSLHPITPKRSLEESHPDSYGKKPVLTQSEALTDIDRRVSNSGVVPKTDSRGLLATPTLARYCPLRRVTPAGPPCA